jgi:hypothetical protein
MTDDELTPPGGSSSLDDINAILDSLPDDVTDTHHRPPGRDVRKAGPPPVPCLACKRPTAGELWVRPPLQYGDDPVYFCERCAHIPIPSSHGDWTYTIAQGLDLEDDCYQCGRRFHYDVRARRIYCSHICAARSKAQSYRDAHRPDNARVCAVCGQPFTPPRSDAKTCSNACRQKAYRDRQD